MLDVVLITALPSELKAVLDHGGPWQTIRALGGSNREYHVMQSQSGLRVGALAATDMGPLNAAIVTADVLSDYAPRAVILVGIAAGIGHARLGDLVVSDQIVDIEPAKVTADEIQKRWRVYPSDPILRRRMIAFSDQVWIGRVPRDRPDGAVNVHTNVLSGVVLSGSKVLADGATVTALKIQWAQAVALEMEAAGVAATIERDAGPRFIMVKGICDHADAKKDDRWQRYAAETSAAFTLSFLNSGNADEDLRSPPGALADRIVAMVTRQTAALQPFQKTMVQSLVTAGLAEIRGIADCKYETVLGHGHQFLMRARPLFKNASRIFATSLDTISTFWTNRTRREEALEYLNHQDRNGTTRLFVFSTAHNAHQYAEWLDAHEKAYQSVFVCSMEQYRKILRSVSNLPAVDGLLQHDFAVLEYQREDEPMFVLARLDERQLRFEQINPDVPGDLDFRAYMKFFDNLQQLKPGKVHPDYGVIRWRQRFWQDEKWPELLTHMFDNKLADVFHLVFFNIREAPSQVREMFIRVKRRIMHTEDGAASLANKYGLKEIWFGRRFNMQPPPTDGEYLGEIATGNSEDFPCLLLMRFDTEDGLKHFYLDKVHSQIRRELYEAFDDRISALYDIAEHDEQDRRRLMYDCVEAVAGRYIQRRDYRDDEMIVQMVKSPPYPVFE